MRCISGDGEGVGEHAAHHLGQHEHQAEHRGNNQLPAGAEKEKKLFMIVL